MKVKEIHEYNNDDHGEVSGVEIEITTATGTQSISISEGEPEDMYFFRDLSGVLNITDLIKAAYEAGKNGEPWEYELESEEEEE